MGKKTHKSNYVIWFLIFAVVSGVLFASSNSNELFSFQISPLSVANVELPDVVCNVKATVTGLDSEGNIVLTGQSSAFDRHPKTTFSLVGGESNTPIDEFQIDNKMRCDFINGATFVPMTVSNSDLKVVIFAKDSVGVEKEVWNKSIDANITVPIVNNHEEIISIFNADFSDIDKFLEQGNYETTLRFVTFGTVTLHYDVVPSVKYDVSIPDNKVVTQITLDVTKDEPSQSGQPQSTSDPRPPVITSSSILPLQSFEEFTICAQLGDMNCLLQEKFLPIYILLAGLGLVIGALTTRKKPMFDAFGNKI
jgi:hypothetical protein